MGDNSDEKNKWQEEKFRKKNRRWFCDRELKRMKRRSRRVQENGEKNEAVKKSTERK